MVYPLEELCVCVCVCACVDIYNHRSLIDTYTIHINMHAHVHNIINLCILSEPEAAVLPSALMHTCTHTH